MLGAVCPLTGALFAPRRGLDRGGPRGGGASARGCGIVPGRHPATALRRVTGQHCSPVRSSPASCLSVLYLYVCLHSVRRRIRIVARGWRIRPEASHTWQPDTARHTPRKTLNRVGDAGEHRRAPRPDLSKGTWAVCPVGLGPLAAPARHSGAVAGGASVYSYSAGCRGCRALPRDANALPSRSRFFFLSLFFSFCIRVLALRLHPRFGSPWSVNASRADATSLRHLDGCVVGRAPCSSQNVRVAMRRYSRGLRWLRHWVILVLVRLENSFPQSFFTTNDAGSWTSLTLDSLSYFGTAYWQIHNLSMTQEHTESISW